MVWLQYQIRKKGKCPKLTRSWCGPFVVVEQLSDVLYKIQKTPQSIMHADRLKLCYGRSSEDCGFCGLQQATVNTQKDATSTAQSPNIVFGNRTSGIGSPTAGMGTLTVGTDSPTLPGPIQTTGMDDPTAGVGDPDAAVGSHLAGTSSSTVGIYCPLSANAAYPSGGIPRTRRGRAVGKPQRYLQQVFASSENGPHDRWPAEGGLPCSTVLDFHQLNEHAHYCNSPDMDEHLRAGSVAASMGHPIRGDDMKRQPMKAESTDVNCVIVSTNGRTILHDMNN